MKVTRVSSCPEFIVFNIFLKRFLCKGNQLVHKKIEPLHKLSFWLIVNGVQIYLPPRAQLYRWIKHANVNSVFIKLNEKHMRVPILDILYLEASGSYLKLVTAKGEFFLSQNLSQFMRKNPISKFLRVHRSYVVNMDCVDSFDQDFIYLGLFRIPISDKHKSEFFSHIHCL